AGLTLTTRLGTKTVLSGEVARTETEVDGTGHGRRLELRHEDAGLQVRVWGARTDAGFSNVGSSQAGGQSQVGAKIGQNLGASDRLVLDALRTTSSTGAEQTGVDLKLEHSLPGNMKIEVGLRHSRANVQAARSAAPLPGTSTTSPGVALPVVPAAPAAAAAASEQAGYT
ncbi:MAG: hypothetical protein CFE45_41435, partial [Burkholderiales bacterium PBB5]